MPYAKSIALPLNETLDEYVNRGEKQEEVRRFMHSLMKHHEEFGANDTEPRAFLESALKEIYKA